MKIDRFLAEYMGTFEADQRLHDLGLQYHHRCDAFDDEHLTGPLGPEAGVLPANSYERAGMLRNAEEVRRHVLFLGEQMGYTRAQVEEAIRATAGEEVR
jgi:hypothetical protein